MHHHAGGLVDDGEVLVFVDDIERDVLRRGSQRSRMGLAGDEDLFAAAELERGLGLRAVDEDVALIEQEAARANGSRLRVAWR